MQNQQRGNKEPDVYTDYGPAPFAANLRRLALRNKAFRTAIWTGDNMQVTLMSIDDEIGMETHPNRDQMLYIVHGNGLIMMGRGKNRQEIRRRVGPGTAIMIPAGAWHNLFNTGNTPLKLFSVYSPTQHQRGTIHMTREDAEREHNHH